MSRRTLSLTLSSGATSRRSDVAIDDAIIAGWTGRDPAAVEKHVRELEALGVKRPASTPIFYRVGAARLTTVVLLQHDGRLWVGAGSDHTDREAEAYGVTVSKQMCDKPLAPVFWAFDEVAPHWDQLKLRAHVVENGERKLYQEGGVTSMLAPLDLIGRCVGSGGAALPENTIMYCGTLAARGGVRPTPRFEYEIEDPVLGRSIAHAYAVRILPIMG
jgi:hypothetical protein